MKVLPALLALLLLLAIGCQYVHSIVSDSDAEDQNVLDQFLNSVSDSDSETDTDSTLTTDSSSESSMESKSQTKAIDTLKVGFEVETSTAYTFLFSSQSILADLGLDAKTYGGDSATRMGLWLYGQRMAASEDNSFYISVDAMESKVSVHKETDKSNRAKFWRWVRDTATNPQCKASLGGDGTTYKFVQSRLQITSNPLVTTDVAKYTAVTRSMERFRNVIYDLGTQIIGGKLESPFRITADQLRDVRALKTVFTRSYTNIVFSNSDANYVTTELTILPMSLILQAYHQIYDDAATAKTQLAAAQTAVAEAKAAAEVPKAPAATKNALKKAEEALAALQKTIDDGANTIRVNLDPLPSYLDKTKCPETIKHAYEYVVGWHSANAKQVRYQMSFGYPLVNLAVIDAKNTRGLGVEIASRNLFKNVRARIIKYVTDSIITPHGSALNDWQQEELKGFFVAYAWTTFVRDHLGTSWKDHYDVLFKAEINDLLRSINTNAKASVMAWYQALPALENGDKDSTPIYNVLEGAFKLVYPEDSDRATYREGIRATNTAKKLMYPNDYLRNFDAQCLDSTALKKGSSQSKIRVQTSFTWVFKPQPSVTRYPGETAAAYGGFTAGGSVTAGMCDVASTTQKIAPFHIAALDGTQRACVVTEFRSSSSPSLAQIPKANGYETVRAQTVEFQTPAFVELQSTLTKITRLARRRSNRN